MNSAGQQLNTLKEILGKQLLKSVWVDYFLCFGLNLQLSALQVGKAPMTTDALAGVAVKYRDDQNAEQTIADTDYVLDLTDRIPAIRFAKTPSVQLSRLYANPVSVGYTFDPLTLITQRTELKVIKQCVALLAKAIFSAKSAGSIDSELDIARGLLEQYSVPAV